VIPGPCLCVAGPLQGPFSGPRPPLTLMHTCPLTSPTCYGQINSNPLGSDGARAIMRAMRNNDGSDQRSIGIESCTLHNVVVFDPTKPAGTYSLDLSQAYDRVWTCTDGQTTSWWPLWLAHS
jgi:hypothetical protein